MPALLNFLLWCAIKLEREKVLPKAEQKIHKKREKQEKKKEKKEKEKTQGLNKRSKKLDDRLNGFQDEQLENSDLTEEYEPAVCYISDGSQSSNKRKRETLSSSECRVDGSMIKIRLALKKPRQPDAFLSGQGQPTCSASGRVDSTTQPKAQEQCYLWSNKANASTAVPEQKIRCDDERREQILYSAKTSVNDNEMQKAALQYKTFIEDWMPLSLQAKQSDDDDDDDDWLFRTMHQGKPAGKSSKVDNEVTCRASATSFPRAHFLPGADIYALPYAVRF